LCQAFPKAIQMIFNMNIRNSLGVFLLHGLLALLTGLAVGTVRAAEGTGDGVVLDAPANLNQIEQFRNDARKALDKLKQAADAGKKAGPITLLIDFHPRQKFYFLDLESGFSLARVLSQLRSEGIQVIGYISGSVTGHGVLAALACSELLMSRAKEASIGPVFNNEAFLADPTILAEYQRVTQGRFAQAVVRRWLLPGIEVVEGAPIAGPDPFPFLEKKALPLGRPVLSPADPYQYQYAMARKLGLVKGDTPDSLKELLGLYDLKQEILANRPGSQAPKPVIVDIEGELSPARISRIRRVFDRARAEGYNLVILKLEGAHGGSIEPIYTLAQEIVQASRNPDPVNTICWYDAKCSDTATFIALAADQTWLAPDAKLGKFGDYLSVQFSDTKKVAEYTKSLLTEKGWKENDAALFSKALVEIPLRLRWAKQNGQDGTWGLWDSNLLNQPNGVQMDLGPMIKPSHPDDEGKVLQLPASLARDPLKIADTAVSFADLQNRLGMSKDVHRLGTEWLDQVADFLTLPSTQVFLAIIGMACLMIETMKPGLGLPGVIASLCFVMIFWSNSYVQGQIDWLAILIFLLGIILVLVEVFVIPGFGVVGLSGILMILGGMGLVAYGHWPTSPGEWMGLAQAMAPFGLSMVGSLILAGIVLRFIPRIPFFNHLILQRTSDPASVAPDPISGQMHLLGKTGKAVTALRPSGTALIQGQYLDVISEGDFIEVDSPIEVIDLTHGRILVRNLTQSQDPSWTPST